MKKLEKIWLDGKLVNWDDANVHILTHSLHYGLAAFEGERCYACDDGRSAIFRHKEHTERLFNSAKIYFMDIPYSRQAIMDAQGKLFDDTARPGSATPAPVVEHRAAA